MSGGSSFLSWLRTNAWNPQTSGGTDWTNVGSYSDGTVSAASSVDMGAAHKVLYESSANVAHGDYYVKTSTATTAPVRYNDNGGPWYSWTAGYWPVRWSATALHQGGW